MSKHYFCCCNFHKSKATYAYDGRFERLVAHFLLLISFYTSENRKPLVFWYLKLVYAIFHQIFIFLQMIALQKLWKMLFISSKKLFSFWRYSNFCIFVFPSFLPVSHCFRCWSEKNFKIYDVINSLNKNLITNFVFYLEKEIRCDIET